jgi:hypothetical protein
MVRFAGKMRLKAQKWYVRSRLFGNVELDVAYKYKTLSIATAASWGDRS